MLRGGVGRVLGVWWINGSAESLGNRSCRLVAGSPEETEQTRGGRDVQWATIGESCGAELVLVVGGTPWLFSALQSIGGKVASKRVTSEQAGAAAPCEHWRSVTIVEGLTCGAPGVEGMDRRRSAIPKGDGTACLELVRESLATNGRFPVVQVTFDTSTDHGNRCQ